MIHVEGTEPSQDWLETEKAKSGYYEHRDHLVKPKSVYSTNWNGLQDIRARIFEAYPDMKELYYKDPISHVIIDYMAEAESMGDLTDLIIQLLKTMETQRPLLQEALVARTLKNNSWPKEFTK